VNSNPFGCRISPIKLILNIFFMASRTRKRTFRQQTKWAVASGNAEIACGHSIEKREFRTVIEQRRQRAEKRAYNEGQEARCPPRADLTLGPFSTPIDRDDAGAVGRDRGDARTAGRPQPDVARGGTLMAFGTTWQASADGLRSHG